MKMNVLYFAVAGTALAPLAMLVFGRVARAAPAGLELAAFALRHAAVGRFCAWRLLWATCSQARASARIARARGAPGSTALERAVTRAPWTAAWLLMRRRWHAAAALGDRLAMLASAMQPR